MIRQNLKVAWKENDLDKITSLIPYFHTYIQMHVCTLICLCAQTHVYIHVISIIDVDM